MSQVLCRALSELSYDTRFLCSHTQERCNAEFEWLPCDNGLTAGRPEAWLTSHQGSGTVHQVPAIGSPAGSGASNRT